MTGSDLALVDTNVLVYSLYSASEHHMAARALVDAAKSANAHLCVTAQVLMEYYATVTNPRRVSSPRKPAEAVEDIETFLERPGLTVLPTPVDVETQCLALLRRYGVRGARVFDIQLIATMLGNGVNRIYTFNRADFEGIREIEVITP